jgi:head-tail adaptor
MTAGRRSDKIVIQRGTPTADDYGGETMVWATLANEWAAVFYGRGDERRQAAVEQGQQSATFQCLSNANTRSVTLEDRISHGASTWDIISIAPDTPKRGEIEFTAVRAL